MLKKRLIFTLLWQKGAYCLSRNFKLQTAGDLTWIKKHYNFQVIAFSIDELVVLNVARGDKGLESFAADVAELTRGCFVPLAAGGGIRSLGDARLLLNSGADKLVVNTPLYDQPDLVRELAQQFGRQCVVGSIDYKRTERGTEVFTQNGARPTGKSVEEAVAHAQGLGVGEIYLTSIERDGTGQGYDMGTLLRAIEASRVPLIASGGVGNFDHLADWLVQERASAAATANIFNFLGAGLIEARHHIAGRGIPLAQWEFGWKG